MHHTQETTAQIHIKSMQVRKATPTLLPHVSSAANNSAGLSYITDEIGQDYADSTANSIAGFIKLEKKKAFNTFKTPREHLFLT